MSADFWAGYASGAVGILIGNPLDLLKVRLQAGDLQAARYLELNKFTSLVKGVPAPILGYGALNPLLFMSYNRALLRLDASAKDPSYLSSASLLNVWAAGALAGFATWIVSAPTELVKCRTQVGSEAQSSLKVVKDVWRREKVPGFYVGGGVTSIRDAVGYGFYFWSYELSRRIILPANGTEGQTALGTLLCGGIAGVVTWASVFPLDVIKTRVQTQALQAPEIEQQASVASTSSTCMPGQCRRRPIEIARHLYKEEGSGAFFRGLQVCSLRAFVVNAVQWAVYEWIMKSLKRHIVDQT